MHVGSVANGAALPSALGLLTVDISAGANCATFMHFKQGVLTSFNTTTELQLITTRIKSRGFRLPVTTTAASLLVEFSYLPTFIVVSDTRRSLADDSLGYRFTVNFDISMGNAPSLVCGMDSTLTSVVGSACKYTTVIDGNYIGGYFILGTSQFMSASIAAADMKVYTYHVLTIIIYCLLVYKLAHTETHT